MSLKYFGKKEKVEQTRVVALFRLNELTHVPGNNLKKFVPVLTEKKKVMFEFLCCYIVAIARARERSNCSHCKLQF